jgi:phosphopantothenoylcysteine decarboxylase/phosphopantothenate--cysteine ligase
MPSLKEKKIIIGISGGIALYKVCSLVRAFIKEGASVRVVMSQAATQMITPMTFQALSGSPVLTDDWESNFTQSALSHIELADWGEIFVLAPATANTIAKIAHGLADNCLTSTILAFSGEKALVIAPSMNKNMWSNPSVQENIEKLKKRNNYYLVGPEEGTLANKSQGMGRLAEINQIFEKTQSLLLNK